MLWRPAPSLPRLLFFWRRVGHGRAGVRGRGYAGGVGSTGGVALSTGGAGSRSAVGTSSLQASLLNGPRSMLWRSVIGWRWRHSGSTPKDGGSAGLHKVYIGVNKAIAQCREKGDADGLLGIVRKQSREGGAASLEFNYVNCSTWLNGWSKVDLTRLRGPCPPEVLLVLGRALHLLKTQPGVWGPHAIGNVANGVCKLQYEWAVGAREDLVLMEELAQWSVLRGLGDFTPQAIANLTNAFAKLEHSPGAALLDMIAQECVRRRLQDFTPQAIANLANAFAKLEHSPGAALLDMIAQECLVRDLKDFTPQAIANAVNAFAAFKHYPGKGLLELICRECVGRGFSSFKAQNIANLLHGLATLRYHPGRELLDLSLSRCLAMRFEDFNGQTLSNVLQALALYGHVPSQAFVGCFLERCRQLGWGAFTNQNLHLTLWSCLVLQLEVDKGLLQEILARMRSARVSGVGGKKGLDHEKDLLALCTAMKQWVSMTGGGEAPELRQEVDRVWEIVGSRMSPPRTSGLQSEACKALQARRYKVEEEVVLSDGVLSLDMVIVLKEGRRVGVEVDGPSHFFVNRPQEAMGHTLLKRRLLDRAVERGELQGWVSVRDASIKAMRQVDEAVKTAERS